MQQNNELSPWQAWSIDVQNKINAQQECIDKLQTKVLALCEQVNQLEARPTYNIESIAYHFDQLKVEKLDGTLNIGMTTPGMGDSTFPGTIEQVSVSKPLVFPSAESAVYPQAGPYNDVYNGMNQYLEVEAPQKLMSYENELCLPLDPYHRRIIINDIRKQVPTRIQYYLQQSSNTEENAAGLDQNTMTANVLNKTMRDADSALLAYMQQLQNGAPPPGGKA